MILSSLEQGPGGGPALVLGIGPGPRLAVGLTRGVGLGRGPTLGVGVGVGLGSGLTLGLGSGLTLGLGPGRGPTLGVGVGLGSGLTLGLGLVAGPEHTKQVRSICTDVYSRWSAMARGKPNRTNMETDCNSKTANASLARLIRLGTMYIKGAYTCQCTLPKYEQPERKRLHLYRLW